MAVALTAVLGENTWDLKTPRVPVTLPSLPPAFDGFTIAQLTDIHRGGRVPQSWVEHAVEVTNQARPDLVVVTGDCVTGSLPMMRECAQALGGLSAPYGRFAVLGNHEHLTNAPECERLLVDVAGFTVLTNRSVRVRRGDASIVLVGLDDAKSGSPDLDRALAGVRPGDTVIALSHQPDLAAPLSRRGVRLVLSGHTHGGQVALPGGASPFTDCRVGPWVVSGLHRVGPTQLYVSRGVGVAVVTTRILCAPEIPLLTLRR